MDEFNRTGKPTGMNSLDHLIPIIERLGAIGALAALGWWIVCRQIPAERERSRQQVQIVSEQHQAVMQQVVTELKAELAAEREVCRASAEAIVEQTMHLREMRAELRVALGWDGNERRNRKRGDV